jgi:hypothetical protein
MNVAETQKWRDFYKKDFDLAELQRKEYYLLHIAA